EHAASADQLAAEAGVVPVTRASGKSRAVVFRYATNKRARQALVRWADNSRHDSPWARNIYETAREQGKRHTHAMPILARPALRGRHAPSCSAMPPRNGRAKPWSDGPTTPDTILPGPETSTKPRVNRVNDSLTRCGSSPAPGCGSSTPAGATEPATTPPPIS